MEQGGVEQGGVEQGCGRVRRARSDPNTLSLQEPEQTDKNQNKNQLCLRQFEFDVIFPHPVISVPS